MPPTLFRPTIIVILAIVGLGAAYDLWAVSQNYAWTISANLWQIARYTDAGPPIVAVTFFLIGHVIFPNRGTKLSPPPAAP